MSRQDLDAADKWREKATQLAGALCEALEGWEGWMRTALTGESKADDMQRIAELTALYKDVNIAEHVAQRKALEAGLKEALLMLAAYIDSKSDALCAAIIAGAEAEVNIAATKTQIIEHAGRVDELSKLVEP